MKNKEIEHGRKEFNFKQHSSDFINLCKSLKQEISFQSYDFFLYIALLNVLQT